MTTEAPAPPDVIRGTLARIKFESDDGEFAVAELDAEDGRRITIVGNLLESKLGQSVEIAGTWQHHSRFGQQLSIQSIHPVVPTTPEAIETYLSSGLIEGIGPVLAERIVAHFGADTLDILDDNPHRIIEVEGIGRKRAESIISAWLEQRAIRSVMIFLQSHGISPRFASRIWKFYGSRAIQVIQKNPYRLADDIFGIGFKKADEIAHRAGIADDDPARIRAGFSMCSRSRTATGTCICPRRNSSSGRNGFCISLGKRWSRRSPN